MQNARHVEEIGQVLEGGQTGRDSVVSASWRRCVELYGMDPMRSDPAHIVTETELRDQGLTRGEQPRIRLDGFAQDADAAARRLLPDAFRRGHRLQYPHLQGRVRMQALSRSMGVS